MYICMSMSKFSVNVDAHGGQMRVLDTLELEL